MESFKMRFTSIKLLMGGFLFVLESCMSPGPPLSNPIIPIDSVSKVFNEYRLKITAQSKEDPLIGIWSGAQCGFSVVLAVVLNDEGTPYKLKAVLLNGSQIGYGYFDGHPWFYVNPSIEKGIYEGTITYRNALFQRWFPTSLIMNGRNLFTTHDNVNVRTCGGTVHSYLRKEPSNEQEASSSLPVKVYQSGTLLPSEINIPISTITVIPSGTPSILPLVEPAVQQGLFNLKKLYKRMRIIDRADIKQILEEQILQSGGLVAESTAVKLGKMAGVQTILTYQIQTTPDAELELIRARGGTISSSISAKLISVETGEVLFQTTTFDHRQIDLPQNHGRDQWSEVKMWRIQGIENAGEQAMADFEAALLWGKIGWYVTDMPLGRIGTYVKRVYPGGLASLARIQPQDYIWKIETPELTKSSNIPTLGFWFVQNKEMLLDLLSLPTDSFVFTLNRNGKDEKVKFLFTQDQSTARICFN